MILCLWKVDEVSFSVLCYTCLVSRRSALRDVIRFNLLNLDRPATWHLEDSDKFRLQVLWAIMVPHHTILGEGAARIIRQRVLVPAHP